jgi:hypothetical protein
MRDDQRLERDREQTRRARRARGGTATALAFVLAFSVAGARAAERPDLVYPELAPPLPEPEASPSLVAPPELAPKPSELRLLWFDPKGLFPPAFDVASREVTRIFHGVGVDVRFERGTPGVHFGGGSTLDIPVILLGQDPMPSRASRRVMGLVPRPADGARVVWVFLSSVRWTLGQDPRSGLVTPKQANELGLALSRVVAHEVVHAIAPEEPHAASGLMHHSMDRSFLVGGRARIDGDCARSFVRHLGELLTPPVGMPAPRMGAARGDSAP